MKTQTKTNYRNIWASSPLNSTTCRHSACGRTVEVGLFTSNQHGKVQLGKQRLDVGGRKTVFFVCQGWRQLNRAVNIMQRQMKASWQIQKAALIQILEYSKQQTDNVTPSRIALSCECQYFPIPDIHQDLQQFNSILFLSAGPDNLQMVIIEGNQLHVGSSSKQNTGWQLLSRLQIIANLLLLARSLVLHAQITSVIDTQT